MVNNDYTEYLAVNVLNEQQLVSYRSLSRALKVHCNLAKQMLFDFHQKQNARKSASVHATYLITGMSSSTSPRSNGKHTNEDEDVVMQSSPPLPGSSAPDASGPTTELPVSSKVVMLVREENLEEARSRFDRITSIHIYSLQAKGISDLQTLRECNRQVASNYATEDPLKDWKQYGTIQNPHAKRRTRKGGPPPAPAPLPKAEAKINPAPATKPNDAVAEKVVAKPTPPKSTASTAPKKDTSNLFKSFAKAKPPKKKDDPKPEDESMADFSDEDAEDNSPTLPEADADAKAPTGKSKKEREADLAAMMDQEDEPMEDADPEPADLPEPEPATTSVDAAPAAVPAPEPKETVTVENGRRRGRRKVMKKKTVKDEDGYLVTREEAAWESFSEEEPAPKKLKSSASTSGSTTTSAANKKPTGKPGQGNIMSFFGKK